MAKKTIEKKEKVFSPEEKAADLARKRAMKAIFEWSERSRSVAKPQKTEGETEQEYKNRLYNFAKAVACQSYGHSPAEWHGNFGELNVWKLNKLFNSIPTKRITNIYNAFRNMKADEANAIRIAQDIITNVN